MASTEPPTPEAPLAELERLDKAATPGPWRNYLSILVSGETDAIFWPSMSCDAVAKDVDVDLIVAMRNALPQLLADTRELASLKSRGITMSQEHLDGLLKSERESERCKCARWMTTTAEDPRFSEEERDMLLSLAESMLEARGTAAPGEEEK